MKYLITTSALFQIFLFGTLTINAQELRVNTSYSRLDGGSSYPEKFEFYFTSGGWLNKTNLYNYTSENFPSSLEESSYDDNGYYYETYSPVSYIENNPLEWTNNYGGSSLRLYKIVYNKKFGEVLYIVEIIGRNQSNARTKYYLTELGKLTFK
ncbi:MAG: hypothetical protein RLZZ529_208 [Bacteroidota bacterium]|jgi:hypothetical protein